MKLDDKAKEVVDFVREGYVEAETEVDNFFVRNKFTVVILTGVAIALVVFGWSFLKSLFS